MDRCHKPIPVFESANILLYLAEKFGKLIPSQTAGRTEVLNWLFPADRRGTLLGRWFRLSLTTPRSVLGILLSIALPWKPSDNWIYWDELAKRSYIAGDDYSIAGYCYLVLVWDKYRISLPLLRRSWSS